MIATEGSTGAVVGEGWMGGGTEVEEDGISLANEGISG